MNNDVPRYDTYSRSTFPNDALQRTSCTGSECLFTLCLYYSTCLHKTLTMLLPLDFSNPVMVPSALSTCAVTPCFPSYLAQHHHALALHHRLSSTHRNTLLAGLQLLGTLTLRQLTPAGRVEVHTPYRLPGCCKRIRAKRPARFCQAHLTFTFQTPHVGSHLKSNASAVPKIVPNSAVPNTRVRLLYEHPDFA